MAKKKVCVSFDFEHDKSYYYLLEAWNSNPNIDFSINDCTPSEIQSESISKIKQVLSTKIGQANYMIAIIEPLHVVHLFSWLCLHFLKYAVQYLSLLLDFQNIYNSLCYPERQTHSDLCAENWHKSHQNKS